MKCYQCGTEIPEGEGIKYNRRHICEDCYIDNTVVTRTCDPDSIRIAKNMENLGISSGRISPLQERIIEIIERTGGITPEELSKELDMPAEDLLRNIAILRQMRRIQGEKRGEERYIIKYRG